MWKWMAACLAVVVAHAADAAQPQQVTLTDMLIFSADATGGVVGGHGADTKVGPHLNGSNLFDIFVSTYVPAFDWASCEPFACPDAANLLNPDTTLNIALQKGDNRFRFYTNLPFPGYADPGAIKSYQIAFYFNGQDYLLGAAPGLAAYVDQDGLATLYAGPISNGGYGPFAAGSGKATYRAGWRSVELRSLIFRWDWLYHDTGIGYVDLFVR